MDLELIFDADVFLDKGTPRIESIISKHSFEMRRVVALEAWDYIVGSTSVFKNPTGNYKNHLSVEELTDRHVLTDQGLPYGPWLEHGGRGGFEGYQLWEKTYNHTEREMPKIVEEIAREMMRELTR